MTYVWCPALRSLPPFFLPLPLSVHFVLRRIGNPKSALLRHNSGLRSFPSHAAIVFNLLCPTRHFRTFLRFTSHQRNLSSASSACDNHLLNMATDDRADIISDVERYDLTYSACCNGLLEELKVLLPELLAKSPTKKDDLRNLLFAACSSAHSEVVSYLLSEGAIVNQNDVVRAARDAKTPQWIQVFQTLLDHGWNINADDRNYGTV